MRATMAEHGIHPHRTWQAVLGRLELEMAGPNFTTWMEGTRAIAYADGFLSVEATSAFACDYLNDRLRPMIERALAQVAGYPVAVRFQAPGAADTGDEMPETFMPAPAAPQPEPARLVGDLNDAFTLETYIEAEGNLLARNACRDLVDEGTFGLSPVVVYGAPGVGKTHLLHALAREARTRGWSVACLSAEQFTNRYLAAMRDRDASGFHAAVRQVRLFLLDDLQYLAGKTGTANELVHTIDAVVNAGGDVVIAGECHPAEIDLPERLISRLTSGLVTSIETFRADERRYFVEQTARQHGVDLPEWAITRLASLNCESVRALRGATNRALMLARYNRLTVERLDADLVTTAVASAVEQQADAHEEVLEQVAKSFRLAVSDLVGRSRRRDVSEARAVAAAALREQGLSLAETAEALGGRDRSTIRQLAERGREIAASQPALRIVRTG